MFDKRAGVLIEELSHYVFTYDHDYKGKPISLSMPLSKKEYISHDLHPYFKGLVVEGW